MHSFLAASKVGEKFGVFSFYILISIPCVYFLVFKIYIIIYRSSASSSTRSSSESESEPERKGAAPRLYSDSEDDSDLNEAEVKGYPLWIGWIMEYRLDCKTYLPSSKYS